MTAAELHAALAGRWPDVLAALGVDAEHLVNRHGPCPACGGRDRFRFDDRDGRGTWICNQCGAGDGFRLLELVHGWTFREALKAVAEQAGPVDRPAPPTPRTSREPRVASPTARARRILRTSSTPDLVPDARGYLESRGLFPLPDGCRLRAHAAVDYFEPGPGKAVVHVGRFPALVAPIVDIDGERVTVHVTYLHDGAKLTDHAPRKILSPMTGRRGCAVRLFELAGETLGLAEGIETAIAARILHDMPVWAALNTTLLAKFIPPRSVHRVLIFADRDVPGIEAAWTLRDELDGHCGVELRLPPRAIGDWNDALLEARHG